MRYADRRMRRRPHGAERCTICCYSFSQESDRGNRVDLATDLRSGVLRFPRADERVVMPELVYHAGPRWAGFTVRLSRRNTQPPYTSAPTDSEAHTPPQTQ